MKSKYILPLAFILCCTYSFGQVGIGSTTPFATLDIQVSNPAAPAYNDGLLIPRLAALPLINPKDDQHSMLIFLTTTSGAKTPGYYYWDKNEAITGDWVPFIRDDGWKITGNNNVTSGTNFIGTTNSEEVDFRVNNKHVARLTEKGQWEIESDEKSVLIGFEAGENYDPAGTAAEQNVFIGYQAAKASTSGRDNVAVGALSMTSNTTGNFNVGVGDETLENNTTGDNNTALGNDALRRNNDGDSNSAIGRDALFSNTSGDNNTGIGLNAGNSNTTGSNNTYVGNNANAANNNLDNATALGNGAIVNASDQVRIGNTAVNDIGGYAAWSNLSDARFKYDITDNVPGLEFIRKIKPVTYKVDRVKLSAFIGENSPNATNSGQIESGFLAQQVEQVAENLGYEFNGVQRPENIEKSHYTVSYSTFVVPLVKAVQEQQQEIEVLKKKVSELETLKNEIEQLKAMLER